MVVVGVLAILITMAGLGINRYISLSRDEERKADVTIIANALEKYYEQKGEYPGCTLMTATGATLTANTLKGIDLAAILVPNPAGGVTNSIICGRVNSSFVGDYYGYEGDGTANCTSSTGPCARFTLTYKSEEQLEIIEVKSIHQ